MVSRFLKIWVDCQPDIITGNRFHPVARFNNFSDIINVYDFRTLCALELHLHRSFNSGFPDRVVQIIFGIFVLQRLQFFIGYLSGITEYLGKINAVIIFSDSPFGN